MPSYDCSLPEDVFRYALIVKESATISGIVQLAGVAVGGLLSYSFENMFSYTKPSEVSSELTRPSYANILRGKWIFGPGGVIQGSSLPFDFAALEELARIVQASRVPSPLFSGYTVVVIDQGGVYDPSGETCNSANRYSPLPGTQDEVSDRIRSAHAGSNPILHGLTVF